MDPIRAAIGVVVLLILVLVLLFVFRAATGDDARDGDAAVFAAEKE
jgi:hypothetical protein